MQAPLVSRRRLVGTLVAGAASFAWPRAARSQTQPLRVGGTFSDTFAEGFYGRARGAFAKAGLDVTVTQFANGPAQMTAVLGGALDVGLSDTVSLGTAIAKQAPFVLVAGGGMYRSAAPTTALCVPAASHVAKASDLIGKTVAVLGLHDVTEIGTWAWLERNGVATDKVQYTEIPLPAVPPAIARGTVDAGILAEPFLSQNDHSTARVLAYIFDALAPQFFISDWFTSRSFVQQHPDLVKRFVDAIYETAHWANANRDESASILSEVTKLPLATIQKMTRVTYGTSLDPQLLEPIFSAMHAYGVIAKPLTIAEVTA